MLSKEDADGNVTILIPPTHGVTGHSSDGRHTTFFSPHGSFRTRAIEENKAGWLILAPALIALYGGSIAFVLLSGTQIGREMAIPFGFLAFAVVLGGIRAGGFAWKELFFMGAVAHLLTQPIGFADSETRFAIVFAAVAFAGYITLWVTDAVWEPFVTAVVLLALVLAFRFGVVPDRFMAFACGLLAVCSVIACFSIAVSSETYRYGWNNMRE